MAQILNIETSTSVCSVSISNNGKLTALKQTREINSHSKLLTVFIEDIFKENNIDIKTIDAVAVSKGPGSYTGLRIGVSAAKGIAYGLNIPIISVDTMQIISANLLRKFPEISNEKNSILLPMIDARRMEVYNALFDINLNLIKEVSAEIIDENSYSELLKSKKVYFFGDGSDKCKEIILNENAIFIQEIFPSAEDMIEFSYKKFEAGDFENTAYFEPFYLKNFIATVPKKNIYG